MKKIVLILIIFIFSTVYNAYAQYPKLIVQFTNKQFNTFSTANPAAYLSSRAIARRTRYNIAIDSTDLPITQRYIDSVLSKGPVLLLSKSKWLNQILIHCTDAATITKIQALPFVKIVQGVGFRMQQTTREKFIERIEPLPSANDVLLQRNTADLFAYGNSYNQVHIHDGEFLHNKGFAGQGMMITVLDAGFNNFKNITAFDSIRNNAQVLGERDFVAFDNSVNEDDSHGTHCLSTMAANRPGQMVGTSPKANYWLVRTENASSEYIIEEHNWVVGSEFADSCGSDMISSSLGYYDFDDPSFDHTYADFYKNKTMVTQGAALAAKKGILVMNSAGNSGNNSWKYLGFPADADSVCTVGAISSTGVVAGFSSYGYPGKVKPNITSVGAGTIIANTSNGISSGSGTSFSCPNIAGLIACLWQAFPQYNNMKILDAVYKSSPTYSTPNDRVGYGIPNFKTAYRTLKKEQNTALYGNEWLWASPDPFTAQINIRLIGQIDGTAKIELINSSNIIVASKNFATELEEVYDSVLTNLSALPAGNYVVKYTDANKSRNINISKSGTTIIPKDWLIAYPSPFTNKLHCNLQAPETGNVFLRLVDMSGKTIEVIQLQVVQNTIYTINFAKAAQLQSGAYNIQYIGQQKKTIKVVK